MSTSTLSRSRPYTRPYTPSTRPGAAHTKSSTHSRVAPASTATDVLEKKVDWFTVALYALMIIGIGVFSLLAFMIIMPAA